MLSFGIHESCGYRWAMIPLYAADCMHGWHRAREFLLFYYYDDIRIYHHGALEMSYPGTGLGVLWDTHGV